MFSSFFDFFICLRNFTATSSPRQVPLSTSPKVPFPTSEFSSSNSSSSKDISKLFSNPLLLLYNQDKVDDINVYQIFFLLYIF